MPRRHGKRYRADAGKIPEKQTVPLEEAIQRVKAFKAVKFDQSIEIAINLGIDPRQADQAIRGAVSLPHGIGKTKRVIAFCGHDLVKPAKEAGAEDAGGEELVAKIEGGWLEFDVAIASPDMMRVVARLGRSLGPKGLMPSPKSGTVTPNVIDAVKEYRAGKVEFRNDSGGNIHAVVGKQSFDAQSLAQNAQAFIANIERMKPASAKGTFIQQIALSGTMTPGVLVELATKPA
ncbi:MAG: 50S ribosomal protein L1 [Phycisphaeraceae bacterium]